MDTLILASGNKGKLREFSTLLESLNIQVKPQGDYDVPDADETGLTFVENALLKARQAAQYTGLPALADDSGLEVDALQGAPGIRSARFAGTHGDDAANNRLLLERLRDVPEEQRTARFVCVLAVLRHAEDPRPLICEGTWEGRILFAPQGDGGFGYDPLFCVPDLQVSAAELSPADKNRLSHRGQASRLLQSALPAWWR
ncbi:MAG: RdgB/HAM1 family non-canonical purine NTP pyrophosphatase [Natronospirillum sp.]|uniref:RdgB/HAM1 family non-canonical purine NTP pyrophosphatase n=1 Tax=Natronospirillum sp. TaxID=2812955 RepID=UPI0025CDC21D|nr:RdgB/HAM1 family non-canonical purine NTP pyrophosphatase [Natronospirillum sp.]MCH8551777.1 RdgB/HAM1 family non-canonical purine NTP pyrophosphatase [Natronospirillum sp.]